MRFILGFLGAVAVLIFIIVLIVRGGGSSNGPKAIDLADYVTSSSQVILTIDGPVSADQTHNAIRVSVDEAQAKVETITGYEGQVTGSKSYDMNPSAYTNFLLALKHSGFSLGNTSSNAIKDERGYCPLGDRYVYELTDNSQQVFRYWATSCGTSLGTFKGQGSVIRQLFQAQIPDYDEFQGRVTL